MKNFLRQNGIMLAVIALLVSILLGIAGSFLGGSADPVSNAVNVLISPVRGAIAAAVNWTQNVYDYVFRYDEMTQQLQQLRIQVSELEQQVRENQEASRENEQLRALLQLEQKGRNFEYESARVTARSTSNWESTLTLDKGSRAGVAVGNCVVTQTWGLVGIVSEVGTNWATVSTVINPDIELGGIAARSYAAGILEGDFALMQRGRLKLSYLPDGAQLLAGDEVLTSGKGDIYPSGLLVGEVEEVLTDPSGMTRYATIKPNVSERELIEVFVIKSFDIVA